MLEEGQNLPSKAQMLTDRVLQAASKVEIMKRPNSTLGRKGGTA